MNRLRLPNAIALMICCMMAGAACTRSTTRVDPDLVVTAGTFFGFSRAIA